MKSYPIVAWLMVLLTYELAPPSWVFGVSGGTGDPPDSSDGVFDKNRLPPSSETSVIGELQLFFVFCFFFTKFVFKVRD